MIYVFLALTSFIIVTITFVRFNKTAGVFLLLSASCLGLFLYLNSNIFPPDHVSRFLGKDKLKAGITGIIKGPVEARDVYFGKVNSRYVFELEIMDNLKVTGRALIRIQTEKDYQYGDRLLVRGMIKRPAYNKKTNFDYRRYLENRGIFAVINAKEKDVILLARNYRANPVLKLAYSAREKLKRQFLEKMPLETGAFMRAILLGDRSELPRKLNESFRNSGTMHILAISGLNVGLIAAFFIFLFKALRVRREVSYVVTMLLLIFLMLLTGSSPSVVRATVMCVVFMLGMLLGRAVDPYNTLAIAAFFILAKDPKDLFDVGFQLSFLAVLSMVYFTPKLTRLVKVDMNLQVKRYIWSPLAVSMSASIGTFPLIWYYFKMFVPISVVSNMFIVPLVFILMVGGLCFCAAGWVPFVGGLLAGFNNAVALLIFSLAEFFAGVKFGHFNL